jgi:hypothetical protein
LYRKGFNRYVIIDDYAIFYIQNRKGEMFEVYIDTEDLPRLIELRLSWVASWKPKINSYYITTTEYLGKIDGKYKYKHWELHRFLLNSQKGDVTDHKDYNGFNNRKYNLRTTNQSKNSQHKDSKNKNNKSGYRNVFWNTARGKWQVTICKNYERIDLGYYDDLEEAGRVAAEGREKYFGEFKGDN